MTSAAQLIAADDAATEAGLRYVSDDVPGISRKRRGRNFRYVDARGGIVRCATTLARIQALAIPPAWERVWISPAANGHIQATGRDARGRKQYRYHTRWREARDGTKYSRMTAFALALPKLRRHVERDLAQPGLSRDKLLATIVRLLETTCIRIGNAEYARQNDSFGLTTLRARHVAVRGAQLRFQFKGKSGVRHAVSLTDPRLARIVKRCQELPGEELFRYEDDDGTLRSISSCDVNAYLRGRCGEDFTAKDFRTWAGTVLAATTLAALPAIESQTHGKRLLVQAITCVSERLGNTKAVCRKCYVHPAVIEAFQAGTLGKALTAAKGRKVRGLTADENAVLAFLSSVETRSRQASRRIA